MHAGHRSQLRHLLAPANLPAEQATGARCTDSIIVVGWSWRLSGGCLARSCYSLPGQGELPASTTFKVFLPECVAATVAQHGAVYAFMITP